MRILFIAIVVLMVGACASKVPLPQAEVGSAQEAKAAWARVLAKHVDERGRVDFAGVSAQPRDLETWLNYIARVSPRSHPLGFPGRDDQLAYYIDAYNALAMYGVIRSGVLPEQKFRFFLLRRYPVGGEELSLYALENDVIRPLGEPRTHFALNCMSASCPRLPREPWDARQLDGQLEAAAREFFNDERHLRTAPLEATVYLSEILDFYPEDFLAAAPSLIDYVNRFRSEPIPVDYKVAFIPYDWSLIDQND